MTPSPAQSKTANTAHGSVANVYKNIGNEVTGSDRLTNIIDGIVPLTSLEESKNTEETKHGPDTETLKKYVSDADLFGQTATGQDEVDAENTAA